MKHQSFPARACACLLLATAGVHAHAQQAAAAAADPQAAVPATEYQSVLGHKPEAAADASPDRNWPRANDTVAADPEAAVPATRYQSVLGHKPEAAADASPDRNWSGANDTVAATNSMSLTMKGMGGNTGHAGHDHAAMQGMQVKKPKETP